VIILEDGTIQVHKVLRLKIATRKIIFNCLIEVWYKLADLYFATHPVSQLIVADLRTLFIEQEPPHRGAHSGHSDIG
jgi:hypothetical protein